MKDRKRQDMQDRAHYSYHHGACDPAHHVSPYSQHIFFHNDLQCKIITLKDLQIN